VKTTTKKDLIDRIAESTGTRQTLVKVVVQEFFGEITSELAKGNRLEFRDFGVFETKTTPPRVAQIPRTLKQVQVPAGRRVVFRVGRLMREGLNGNGRWQLSRARRRRPALYAATATPAWRPAASTQGPSSVTASSTSAAAR